MRTEFSQAVKESLGEEAIATGADGFMIQFLVDPGRCPSGDQLVDALGAALSAALGPLAPSSPSAL